MYDDAEGAALYDALNPWDPDGRADDGFYFPLVMGAASVLDVGAGTGAMLRLARERGHRGRLMGLDPSRAALGRARRRADVEWVEGRAADAPQGAGFDLATMTGHVFQFLVTDDEVRTSLASVRGALRPGGCLVFETRHPQARAWEGWTAANPAHVVDEAGRALRVWHEVDSVVGDVVTFHSTTAASDGTVLRIDGERLRFLDPVRLRAFLTEAGFEIASQSGDWSGGPVDAASTEIITIARRR